MGVLDMDVGMLDEGMLNVGVWNVRMLDMLSHI